MANDGSPKSPPNPSLTGNMGVLSRLGGSVSEVWQVVYGPPAFLSGVKAANFAQYDASADQAGPTTTCVSSSITAGNGSSFKETFQVIGCASGICPAICPPTWVSGLITFTALQVGQPQQLKNFPMDTQFLNLALVNRAATNALTGRDVLFRFTDDSLASALPLAGDPDGYTIASVALGNATTPEGFGSIQVQWTIKRIPDFFINRFVLPLSLVTIGVIMLMSANPASRAMASFTMMGTVVSFLFVSGQSVPQLPYRTRLDNYFTLHFFMAFVMGLWNVYSTNRIDRVKVDPTESIYTLCGLLAPAAKAPEKKKDDGADKKDDAVALAINAPSGSALEVAVAEQTGVLRRLLAKTEEEAKKNDEVKATAKKDKDNEKARAASALHNDQMFTLLLLGTYVIIVPCLFYL